MDPQNLKRLGASRFVVELTAVQNLIAAWWFDYDQGDVDAGPAYFAPDAHPSCRSDSG